MSNEKTPPVGSAHKAPTVPGDYRDRCGDILHVVSTPDGLRCWWDCAGSRESLWEWDGDLTDTFGPLTYLGPLDTEGNDEQPAERPKDNPERVTTTITTAELADLRTAARTLDEVCRVLGCDASDVVGVVEQVRGLVAPRTMTLAEVVRHTLHRVQEAHDEHPHAWTRDLIDAMARWGFRAGDAQTLANAAAMLVEVPRG